MTNTVERWVLGPQRPEQNLAGAFGSRDFPAGPVAVISAGWQEAEGDLDHVSRLVAQPLVDLGLYQRAEQLMEQDPALREAYRERQDRLIELQRLHRRRMRQLSAAARELLSAEGNTSLLAPERRHAISQLRSLDTHHLNRVESIHREFHEQLRARDHELLASHVQQVRSIMDRCSSVLITGGNVVILINRLLLFGIGKEIEARPLVAWSAGAMALASRIVLFHDNTPHGRRSPEVMGAGLGILPGYIFLPDAQRRLRTNDPLRTGLLGKRFSPDTCVLLNNGAMIRFHGANPREAHNVQRIDRRGKLKSLRVE